MRDLASCLSEYAVQVSDTSCPSYTNINTCINSPAAAAFTPSIQNSVTCLYRTILSHHNQIMMTTVTWTKNASSQSLTINFHHHHDGGDGSDGDEHPPTTFKITTNPSSRLFRKSKGCKSLQLRSSKIEVFWDLSTARYEPGPEPAAGFYVAVLVDSEPGLILGDKDPALAAGGAGARFALVSRREHFSGGSSVCSTKARFSDGGSAHEISIRCSGGENEAAGLKHPMLWVCIDKKTAIRVKKLQWNFRGNQTVFLDGLLVDLMWDVHDWFYNRDCGDAVFMFRRRSSGLDSRLWMEEKKLLQDNIDRLDDFSFMIYACKNL